MRENPDERYAPLFDELRAMDERIETMREELEAAKAAVEAGKNGGEYAEFYDIEDGDEHE